MKVDMAKFRAALQQKIANHTSKASAADSYQDAQFSVIISNTLMEVALAFDLAVVKETPSKIAIIPKVEAGATFNLPCRLVRPVTEPIRNPDGTTTENKHGNLWWAVPLHGSYHANFPSFLICTDGIPVLAGVQS